jgi:hypothetical protein
VWAEYRTDTSGTRGYTYSPPSTSPAYIILNDTGPTANLNSPAGIIDPVNYPSLCVANSQYVNYEAPQWITYSGWSNANPPLTVTFAIDGCPSCSPISGASGLPETPPMWDWPGTASSPDPGYSYLSVTATDESGVYMTTPPPSACAGGPSSALNFYPGGTSSQEVDCYASNTSYSGLNNAVQCTVIADQANADIPNDPPSISYESSFTSCLTGDAIAFSGYADPSIRRDPNVTSLNPYGTNLWMMYSYPWYWQASSCNNTGALAIHIAQSTTSAPDDLAGGAEWDGYCSSDDCAIGTAVWPTEPYCTTSGVPLPYSSATNQPCTAPCTAVDNTLCFSSHEVANMWPDPTTENWYAVHLMYYVPQESGIKPSVIKDGCLVISMAEATGGNPALPTGLGWAAGSGPQSCDTEDFPPNSPANNAPLTWGDLNDAVAAAPGHSNPNCNTWGEPAIMVTLGSGTAYLAASCLDSYGTGTGYYFFTNPFGGNQTNFLNAANWTYWSGPFNLTNNTIPLNAYPPSTAVAPPGPTGDEPVDSVTELDWALRADNTTMMAILTLAYVYDPPAGFPDSSTPYQYGCAAVSLDILNTTNPFGSVLATVADVDNGTSANPQLVEQQGTSSCTYDPASNTGILIVRHLINTSIGVQYQLFALIDTGVLP